MSIYDRNGHQWCKFNVGGKQFRESCGTTVESEASQYEKRRKQEEQEKFEQRKKDEAAIGVVKPGATTPLNLTFDIALTRYTNEVAVNRKDKYSLLVHLTKIMEFLPTIGITKDSLLRDFTDDHMAQLVAWRKTHTVGTYRNDPKLTKPLSNAAINRSVTTRIEELFSRAKKIWLRKFNHAFPDEPVWASYKLKEQKERVRVLAADEFKILSQEIGVDYMRPCLFAILTGLRLQNCLPRKSAVNWEMKTLTVVGKGGKLIYKPLTDRVLALLRECWNDHDEMIFTYSSSGRGASGRAGRPKIGTRVPITYDGLQSRFSDARKRAAKKCPSLIASAEGEMTLRFHDLRHTFATNFQRANGDLRLTQAALDHANSRTSERYSHIVGNDVRAGMEKADDNHYLGDLAGTKLIEGPKNVKTA